MPSSEPESSSCRWCGSGFLGPRRQVADQLYRNEGSFHVAGCAACGSLTLIDPPADVGPYYPAAYVAQLLDADSSTSWRQRFAVDLMERALASPPGRVLDVGCGSGAGLDQYRERGWETWGVELDPAGSGKATARGHHVVRDTFPTPALDGETFDAVRFHHSLEHLLDPAGALTAARQLMRDGALLQVDVPNAGGWVARLSRRYYWQIDPPRHFGIPTLRALRALAARAGFQEVDVQTYTAGYSIANSHALWRFRRALEDPNGWRLLDPRKPAAYPWLALAGAVVSFVTDRAGLGDNLRLTARAT